MDLEAFEMVFLRRPADAPVLDETALEENHRAHLAYLADLQEQGHIVANGPVLDGPDETLRGISIYRTGSLDEARRLAELDPGVQAGRFVVDVATYWSRPGCFRLPGQPMTIDDP